MRVNIWDRQEMKEERKRVFCLVEELLSESDHRSLGGFQTEDTRYALMVRELCKELLDYIEGQEEHLEHVEMEMQGDIDSRDHEISRLEDLVEQVDQWAKDSIRFQNVIKMIKEGRDHY